jgi:hypothetical protein
VDRWNTVNDIPGYPGVGGAHNGWMVMKQTGMGTNFQFLIAHRNFTGSGSENMFYLSISRSAGYTGGGVQTIPSATDEIVLQINVGNTFSQIGFGRMHVMQSTDGKNTRVFMHVSNVCQGLIIIENASQPTAAWTQPFVVISSTTDLSGSLSSKPTYANLFAAATLSGKMNGLIFNPYIATEGANNSPIGAVAPAANDLTGDYIMSSLSLDSLTIGGTRGRIGLLDDMWGGSTGILEGSTYPGDATRQFIQFGNMIFPWNGSVPLIS